MHANQRIQKTTEKVWAQFINRILWQNKEKLNIFELFDLYSFHRCTLVGIYICQYAPICITERHYCLEGKTPSGVVWWFDCATFFNILSTGPGPLHQHPWLKVSLKLPSLGKLLGLLTDYCPWDHSRWPQPCL